MATTTQPKGITPKQPWELLDYDFNMTRWLNAHAPDDTMASAVVVCEDLSLTLGATEVSATVVKQWASGGIDGRTYKLTMQGMTVGGRHVEKEMYIKVKEV